MPEAGRDDSKLLNQRRLALPGKLAERMLAGIVPSASPAASQMQSLGQDSYLPAQSCPAASRRGFSTDGVDSQGSRRIARRRWPGASRCSPPPTNSSPPCCRWPRRPPSGSASMPATWWPRPRWRPAGVNRSSASRMAAAPQPVRHQDRQPLGWCLGARPHHRTKATRRQGGQGGRGVPLLLVVRGRASTTVSFLQGNDRYQNALDSAANPERFMQELQRAGYATDPQYARKVAQIARQMQTYQAVAAAGTPPLG